MQIHSLNLKAKRKKKRIGRGGKKGTYSGKGIKGQSSRAGFHARADFEGGRTPLTMTTPKLRGFKGSQEGFIIVNVGKFDKLFKENEEINPETLTQKGLVKIPHGKMKTKIKILGDGELKGKFTVRGCMVSQSAKKKIEAAKGKVE
jgi:large subunit ribosomal protein L15